MKYKNRIFAGAVIAMASASVMAADQTFTPGQVQEIEQLIHQYIVKNPEVLIEASQSLQKKQQEAMQSQARSAIQSNGAQLFTDNLAVAGNPKGNVTLVEFFDYQCVHCKKMMPIVDSLIRKNPNLRVIYKEFPIFGESSEFATKASLAAAMQGKYLQLHDALLKLEGRLDNELVLNTAKAQGLNMTKLEEDMKSKTIQDAITANNQLAEKMHLMGTPAFIIASTPNGQFVAGTETSFVPGAASEQALQDMINKAVGSKSN